VLHHVHPSHNIARAQLTCGKVTGKRTLVWIYDLGDQSLCCLQQHLLCLHRRNTVSLPALCQRGTAKVPLTRGEAQCLQ
jgi:hypothetical protein